ncbi:MAG: hypothetical protein ACE363_06870 [Alphaproteobacteria bacterium]
MRSLRFISLIVMLGLPSAAWAGVLFEMRTYDYRSGETESSLGYAFQGNVKLGVSTSAIRENQNRYDGQASRRVIINEGTEMIFRPGRKNRDDELILIDHANRSYRVITADSVPSHRQDQRSDYDDRGQIDVFSLFAEAIQQAANERDDEPNYRGTQRRQYNRNIVVRQTSRVEESWFGRCVIWERIRRGVKTHEVCAVDPLRVDLGSAILSETQPMAEFFLNVGVRTGREVRGMIFGLAGINGFPVLTRTFDRDGELINEREFIRAREARLNRRSFLPPRGYRYDRGY